MWWKWWNVALFSKTPWKTTRGKRSFTLAMFCWMSTLFGFDSPRCFEPNVFLKCFWQLQNLTLPRNNLQKRNIPKPRPKSRFRLPVTVFHHIPSIFHHSVSFPLIHFWPPFAHRDLAGTSKVCQPCITQRRGHAWAAPNQAGDSCAASLGTQRGKENGHCMSL